jgi:coenzyme F420-0:L-glutamate ligase/coenzyme F420-1:gamma-L-glutamate ligase
MSSVIDAIKQRRSIRKYSNRRVSKRILNEILDTARWAPSAHNAQPWRFIILADKSSKKNLSQAMAEAWMSDLDEDGVAPQLRKNLFATSNKRFTSAPVVVVACITMADMKIYKDESRQKSERDLAVQSLGAAIQNVLLAAHAKGLGACWFCAPIFCKNVVREVLHFPQSFEPQALVTMGYPDEKPEASERKPFQEIFRSEYWTENLTGA